MNKLELVEIKNIVRIESTVPNPYWPIALARRQSHPKVGYLYSRKYKPELHFVGTCDLKKLKKATLFERMVQKCRDLLRYFKKRIYSDTAAKK